MFTKKKKKNEINSNYIHVLFYDVVLLRTKIFLQKKMKKYVASSHANRRENSSFFLSLLLVKGNYTIKEIGISFLHFNAARFFLIIIIIANSLLGLAHTALNATKTRTKTH